MTDRVLTKSELALFIKSQWAGLMAPDWTRDDIIEFGKLVFAKVPLADVDKSLFARLLPHLSKMAQVQANQVLGALESQTLGPIAAPPAPPASHPEAEKPTHE